MENQERLTAIKKAISSSMARKSPFEDFVPLMILCEGYLIHARNRKEFASCRILDLVGLPELKMDPIELKAEDWFKFGVQCVEDFVPDILDGNLPTRLNEQESEPVISKQRVVDVVSYDKTGVVAAIQSLSNATSEPYLEAIRYVADFVTAAVNLKSLQVESEKWIEQASKGLLGLRLLALVHL